MDVFEERIVQGCETIKMEIELGFKCIYSNIFIERMIFYIINYKS